MAAIPQTYTLCGKVKSGLYHKMTLGSKGHSSRFQVKKHEKYDRIEENTGGVFSCHTEQIPASNSQYLTEAFV